jgi:hypothetical protein
MGVTVAGSAGAVISGSDSFVANQMHALALVPALRKFKPKV